MHRLGTTTRACSWLALAATGASEWQQEKGHTSIMHELLQQVVELVGC